MSIPNIPETIAAIGGLGTAAFGLVDATKVLPWPQGGVNQIGFRLITSLVTRMTPGTAGQGLTQAKILDTLKANWFTGKDLASQKAIAKSLIKANLSSANAPQLAKETGVDATALQTIATSIASGTPLTAPQNDLYSRFDFILTALLDEAYQDADQHYVNGTRTWAFVFAIVLAIAGELIVIGGPDKLTLIEFWTAFIVGVLATPLAPVAKDLTSALASAVNAMQSIKK